MREQPQYDWKPIGSDVKGLEYTVSDLSPRKTYMFRVRAKSPAGELSEPSIPTPFYPLYSKLEGFTLCCQEMPATFKWFEISVHAFDASKLAMNMTNVTVVLPCVFAVRTYDTQAHLDAGPWTEDYSVPDRPYIHSLIVKGTPLY
jgi:hypothetical protein